MTDRRSEDAGKGVLPGFGKSTFFPIFNVNVPMPAGTAMPLDVKVNGNAAGSGADAPPDRTTQS